MPQFEWVNELVPKLRQGMAAKEAVKTIIEFDNNPYLKGIEHLGPLHHAILYKKVLEISYQPYESESPLKITIHPYFLKQYNNRWFLFGYNPEREKYHWNLALDRIKNIQEIKGKYKKNTVINWSDYFEDIIGVTKPEDAPIEKIVLHFYGKTGKYIESKPIHGSQKSKWIDDETLEVTLGLILNYEFERFVMSYGESVKILKPKRFQTLIKARHKMAIEI
jgi:predicted DNA-binding transcriptional regulator YafY